MSVQLPKGDKKLLNAWAFYDWANSVYSLVIASAVFPLFYTALFNIQSITHIDFLGFSVKNSALISFVTAFAFLVVAIISPLLSGVADYVGNKKFFMKVFCYMGALACVGLYWFSLDSIYLSMLFYFLGLLGFWGSLVFYNSYLPDIAFPEQQDAVSAKGYSLGYIGSVILLLFNLVMVLNPGLFGIVDTYEPAAITAMRYSFISVGVWWIAFSQITYYYLPKGNHEKPKVTKDVLFNGYKELSKVWQKLGTDIRLKRYLGSFFVYSMAVQTVMLVATYFGEQEIAWGGDDQKKMGLIVSILLIQIIAVLGAFLTSRASRKFGNIPVLIVINCIWAVICVVAFFITEPVQFYATAGFVGLVMGGIQSLSRSTYSKFLPETKDTTSFFSFYDVSEKIGIVIGMALYGIIDQITGSMRNSVLFLVIFFLVGVILLFRVPKKEV